MREGEVRVTKDIPPKASKERQCTEIKYLVYGQFLSGRSNAIDNQIF